MKYCSFWLVDKELKNFENKTSEFKDFYDQEIKKLKAVNNLEKNHDLPKEKIPKEEYKKVILNTGYKSILMSDYLENKILVVVPINKENE